MNKKSTIHNKQLHKRTKERVSEDSTPNTRSITQTFSLETLIPIFTYLTFSPLISLACQLFHLNSPNLINKVEMIIYAVLMEHSASLTPELVTYLIDIERDASSEFLQINYLYEFSINGKSFTMINQKEFDYSL